MKVSPMSLTAQSILTLRYRDDRGEKNEEAEYVDIPLASKAVQSYESDRKCKCYSAENLMMHSQPCYLAG